MRLGLVSPVFFNSIIRFDLPCHASSAAAEKLFNDSGRIEGDQRQSMLMTNTMSAIVRLSVRNELQAGGGRQIGVLH